MTRPNFRYWFVPVFVPMGLKTGGYLYPIAPISVPIQGGHLVRKPYTLLIYQGVWGFISSLQQNSRPDCDRHKCGTVRATDQGDSTRIRQAMMMCRKKTTRIIEGCLPFYLRRQRLKRAIFLAVCADGNNPLGMELLACSQRMNRDITSSASSPPSININSMWACWPISQSVPSCAFCKHLMIGWSASTNNIIQGRGGSKVWARIPGLRIPSTFFFPQNNVFNGT